MNFHNFNYIYYIVPKPRMDKSSFIREGLSERVS